jgi:excisionase family DNA binding protein
MAMQTIQVHVAINLDENAARTLADLLAPAIKQAVGLTASELDAKREARLRASQNALFGGEKPPEDKGLLIDTRQAAKLLRVSERTLLNMGKRGELPPPIRIGRAVRWSLAALQKWVDAGGAAER